MKNEEWLREPSGEPSLLELCIRFAQQFLIPNSYFLITQKNMTQEKKTRLIKFLWNLASAILAAVGTALGVSCAVMA